MTDLAKMGRPTSNPRDKYIGVRASKNEVEMLDFCTEKTGKSKTDILMEGLEKVYNELKG
ncbi:TPA: hypothetical protein ACJSEZ_000949 [Streptococcus agalactiae]|uniref:hypothetical protein n=1 Tax=Streptococcus agalactiae TaxID=1311 RepID=UPI0007915539|nr:hypothetical protein [Streptococcus agalactiae]MBW1569109.1 hypothetical protein [Streptococcus sp. SPC0]TYL04025.1 hypothetical protein E0F70_02060 [Streptococcus dysgalactiae]KAA9062909.1 hypothetical protein F5H66_02010 [Streptococcus agalactiae]KXA42786.1 hypothetical protein HMPREF1883_01235 [Streptococcus agalactiae]MCC4756856.1 hypothetical protein [Streptococcus agalactiae]